MEVAYIYNISTPEMGGVGRYAFEIIQRAKMDNLIFREVCSSHLYGISNIEKLNFILFKRKRFVKRNLVSPDIINHFLQVEMFYPQRKNKNIVTFHNPPPFSRHNDVSEIFSDHLAFSTSILFYRRYQEALRNADFIIANSTFTKEGIVQNKFDEDKVKVIKLGVNEGFKINRSIRNRRNIIGYVGSFGIHKRLDKLMIDWEKNINIMKGYNLELFGSQGAQYLKLKEKFDNKYGVAFKGSAKPADITNVYNSFRAFIFPTERESFGLPIIESIACGTPVFIYEDAKITPEVKKYATSIKTVAEIPSILDEINDTKLFELSKKVKLEFSWDEHYKKTKQIYHSI